MPTIPKQFIPKWKPKAQDTRTNESVNYRKLYNSQWVKQRKYYLNTYPLCVMCEAQGKLNAATVVDHIIPHKGNEQLFWDIHNWQPLCKPHHDRDKQRIERRGDRGDKK